MHNLKTRLYAEHGAAQHRPGPTQFTCYVDHYIFNAQGLQVRITITTYVNIYFVEKLVIDGILPWPES